MHKTWKSVLLYGIAAIIAIVAISIVARTLRRHQVNPVALDLAMMLVVPITLPILIGIREKIDPYVVLLGATALWILALCSGPYVVLQKLPADVLDFWIKYLAEVLLLFVLQLPFLFGTRKWRTRSQGVVNVPTMVERQG